MASGINGPGLGDSPSHNPHLIPDKRPAASPVKSQMSFGDGMVYTPAAVSSHQDIPTVTFSEPMESHLNFANLMSMQNAADLEPTSAIRRASTAATRGTGMQSHYKPFQRRPSHIAEDIDRVFDHGVETTAPYTEPIKLQFDFGDPDIASEVSTYNEQRFNDADYSSHRRTQTRHSQPLAAHLSSNELKSLKSRTAAATSADNKEKKSRRRHRSSSSSSSSHGGSSKSGTNNDLVPSQRKIKRKEKKKKSGVRKSLTGQLRQRTLSIPEEEEDDEEFMREIAGDLEEEDESEEEEEEEEEDDEVANDQDENGEERPDDDKGGDSSPRRHSGDHDTDSTSKDQDRPTSDGKTGDVMDGGKEKTIVQFSVGDSGVPKVDLSQVPSILLTKVSPPSEGKNKTASFKLGDDEVEMPRRHSDVTEMKRHKKRRHSHQRHHHSSISQRRASGIQLRELDQIQKKKRGKLTSEEGNEEVQSHRYSEHRGIRKHLLHRPVKKRRTKVTAQVTTDRKPHEVFVELDELVSGEWKETARWIKFEEDVEESQQWGKPRVASLSFHSLLELRRTIEKGAVILDLAKDNLTDIANSVVEQMVNSDQIRAEDRGSVLRVLLSKHKHLPEQTGFSYSLSRASFSSIFTPSSTNMLSKMDDEESSVSRSDAIPEPRMPLLDPEMGLGAERGRAGSMSKAATSQSSKELKIMKKIPHDAEATAVLVGSLEYLEQPTMAFVRLATGTELENVVALPIPVRFLFVLLGPTRDDFDYHEIGRSISTLMADEEFHVVAYQAETRGDLLRAINEFLDDSIVLPPGQLENPELLKNIARYQTNLAQRNKKKQQLKALAEKKEPTPPPEDPLRRTKKCFGGLIRDVKRRYPLYWSDIRDAFNVQCLASFIFIYFAALSPAITFGGLLGEKTAGLMGVSEMVVGCCACGCLMALFSGQPMLIVGSTGPLLVFEEAVYAFCGANSLPFLATRFWIGMWICIIAVITVAFEGSFLIRFVSRFTQEIFAVLISLIFIYETFNKLFRIYGDHPLKEYYFDPTSLINNTDWNCTEIPDGNGSTITLAGNLANITGANLGFNRTNTNVSLQISDKPNTALLSTLLMFGTYFIAMRLREFRNSKFLRSSVRRTIGDFGVPIAIFVMVLVDYLITDVYTQKLEIPNGITPTNSSQRGWLINPLGLTDMPMPVWMIFASVLPAFLVFILIFMESHITELIVSKKERCLRKGTGFHLNIVILGLVNFLVSVFGMPWVCAAAVRSITHTNSLTVMSQTQAPGERPKIEATLEQRVTCFGVNAALGLSILMAPVLQEIPIAVLFGIFLYMGVTSLVGVELMDRLKLLFMPSKHYPDCGYVKAVRPYRIHIFTIIEIVCLIILWIVKSTPASIAFPFFLLLTVPLRHFLLPRIFTDKELTEVIFQIKKLLPPCASSFQLFRTVL